MLWLRVRLAVTAGLVAVAVAGPWALLEAGRCQQTMVDPPFQGEPCFEEVQEHLREQGVQP